jgi:hypothetical protein
MFRILHRKFIKPIKMSKRFTNSHKPIPDTHINYESAYESEQINIKIDKITSEIDKMNKKIDNITVITKNVDKSTGTIEFITTLLFSGTIGFFGGYFFIQCL